LVFVKVELGNMKYPTSQISARNTRKDTPKYFVPTLAPNKPSFITKPKPLLPIQH
jgi:hypothetical protein